MTTERRGKKDRKKGGQPVGGDARGGKPLRLARAALCLLIVATVAFLAVFPLLTGKSDILLSAQESGKAARTVDPSPAAPSPGAEETRAGNLRLRVATWNVRDCAAYDASTKERLSLHDGIAAGIRDARADIVVLQEIQADGSKGGDMALLSVALAKAGWAMPYVAFVDAKGEDDLAVFSRYRILASRPVLEPGAGRSWPRPGIHASILVDGTRLEIFNFHFKAMDDRQSLDSRAAQALALADLIRSEYGGSIGIANIVLAGDFNTTSLAGPDGDSLTVRLLTLRDNEDALDDFTALNYFYMKDSATFSGKRNTGLLDHLVVSPALAARAEREDVEILPAPSGPDGRPVSDHSMVAATIRLR